MAFKSFKNKIPRAKHYHPSTNATTSNRNNSNPSNPTTTTATPFFDSSYQIYKRQNHTNGNGQGNGTHSTNTAYRLNDSKRSNGNKNSTKNYPSLHPIISANTNYIEHPNNYQFNTNNSNSCNNNNNTTITTTSNNNNNNATLQQNFNNNNALNFNNTNSNNTHTNIPLFNDVYNSNSLSANNNNNTTSNVVTTNSTSIPQSHNLYIPRRGMTEKDLIDERNPWDEDLENDLNPETYLKIHCEKINECFQLQQYNKINSLYQSLRRNDLIPPIEIYEKIFISFHKRSFDQNNQNLNDKMWQLLNCYQDMIGNKLKPNAKIYNILLLQIFKNSIVAIETNNLNGLDFFKIGSELLTTVTQNNKISNETINYYLLAMNLYARETITNSNNGKQGKNLSSSIIPDLNKLKTHLIELSSIVYEKDSFYFLNLINLANLKNDNIMIKQLYNEFLSLLPLESSQSLKDNQFEIYSMFITSFIETGDLALGMKMFDNIINEIKTKNGSKQNLTMVLSNFIISLSKIDAQKAYSIWFEFNKLDWVPTFSYEFYLLFLSNCFHDWSLTTKIYNYIYPMERTFQNAKNRFQINKFRLNSKTNLSTYLLYPIHTENVINSLMDYALQLRDSDIIMKLLEESMIKDFQFDLNLYPFIFKFLNDFRVPQDYLIRFIEIHGNLQPNLAFLSSITNFFKSDDLLLKIYQMSFFQEICSKLNFSMDLINHHSLNGLDTVMSAVWCSPHTMGSYPLLLKIHGIIITRLFDFDTLDPTMVHDMEMTQQSGLNQTKQMHQFMAFKDNCIDCFTKFVKNYKRLNLDPTIIDPVVPQAAKFISTLRQEYIDYFAHPGDWDKNYPLALGSALRISTKTALKEYENLASKGYCFDYDTYKELINHKYYNQDIINKFLEFSQDDVNELKFARNLLISKLQIEDIENMVILNGSNFQSQVLPYLNETSLIRVMKSLSTINKDVFLRLVNFPYGFKHISRQAEYKRFISFIYEQLYEDEYYDLILELNETCPVLNLEILLESCIRSSNPYNNEKFVPLFKKFQNDPLLLTDLQRVRIEAEYLITKGRIEDATQLLESNNLHNNVDLMNLYSFTTFIQSFQHEIIEFKYTPTTTIQLANMLSTCSSFIGVLNSYDHWKKTLPQEECDNNEEILDQMLQNLVDATKLFQRENAMNDNIKQILNEKLKTFYRFKLFLMNPNVSTQELQQLIHIWQVVNPYSVEHLFNNIVETVYLNQESPATNVLTLQGNMMWEFNEETLPLILEEIAMCFSVDEQKMARLNEFENTLNKLSIPIDTLAI
ncbi:ribonuclease P protein component, mitochondrial [Monosporozyma unispora]